MRYLKLRNIWERYGSLFAQVSASGCMAMGMMAPGSGLDWTSGGVTGRVAVAATQSDRVQARSHFPGAFQVSPS